MKILHTADWHIGKKLYHQELKEDFLLFIDWLVECIVRENVKVLLVSGDIFDISNPATEYRAIYYQSLMKLHKTGCKIIITGGNHDSPNMLNAPKEIMQQIDIHVIGSLPEHYESFCIPIKHNEKVECVILAIPFLRDSDFRKVNEGQNYEERLKIVQKGIENTFKNALSWAKNQYGITTPIIAMGHLFTAGAITSDSEREIQIGNQALFHSEKFSSDFSYIALGHIHKPQRVKHSTPIFYSGSPLPLSFSERSDKKRILILDTDLGFEPKSIEVPSFRKLIRICGNLATVAQHLSNLSHCSTLDSLIEIQLEEHTFNAETIQQLEDIIENFNKEGFRIIHHSIEFKQQMLSIDKLYAPQESLSKLRPADVFEKLIATQPYDQATQQELKLAFQELIDQEYHS